MLTNQEIIDALEAERTFRGRPLTAKERRHAIKLAEDRKEYTETGKLKLIKEK